MYLLCLTVVLPMRCSTQAVTRAKQRLYLTCPQYRWTPRAGQQQDLELQMTQMGGGRDDNVLMPSEFLFKLQLAQLEGVLLAENTPVLRRENLRVLS
jgi:hypothetical protein